MSYNADRRTFVRNASLLMAGAYAAGLPVAQQMTARRLLAAR